MYNFLAHLYNFPAQCTIFQHILYNFLAHLYNFPAQCTISQHTLYNFLIHYVQFPSTMYNFLAHLSVYYWSAVSFDSVFIIQKLKASLNKPGLSNSIIIVRSVYMGTKLNVSLQEVKVKSPCLAKEGIVPAPSIVITLHQLFPRQTLTEHRHTAAVKAHKKLQLPLCTTRSYKGVHHPAVCCKSRL
jgi:branched-subunit amino acid transport protein